MVLPPAFAAPLTVAVKVVLKAIGSAGVKVAVLVAES
jgi:hypothetical protein